jgi:hypothetical protein
MRKILFLSLLIILIFPLFLYAGIVKVKCSDEHQKKITVTVYNDNIALVKDLRAVELSKGMNLLTFEGVSEKIIPETAFLKGEGIDVLEQNFEFNLLTPNSLLKKYMGKEVTIVEESKSTGEKTFKKCKILSVNKGVVVKIGDHIETGIPGKILFPKLPDDLREKPALVMLLKSNRTESKKIGLTYLTKGISWKTDYVAEVNREKSTLNLKAWVTLNNRSGINYINAQINLLAGNINRVSDNFRYMNMERARFLTKAAVPARKNSSVKRQDFSEYHLYKLNRRTNIAKDQIKQVLLFGINNINFKKEYIIKGSSYYYKGRYNVIGKNIKPAVYYIIENKKKNNLGIPLPKGILRAYSRDAQGESQFIGEMKIPHAPENETVKFKIGDAFDVSAEKIETDFKKISFKREEKIYECAYVITVKNAKNRDVNVKILEPIPYDWNILSESFKHVKKTSNIAEWIIPVPAKGKTVLKYRVRIKF